ncbi:MAG: hypothetical protein QME74_11515 [Candidatus Edwardsbacteria bacterium]|nr:hypothetical protein [Candidatus Edwardsbacteria bacterium]
MTLAIWSAVAIALLVAGAELIYWIRPLRLAPYRPGRRCNDE